MYIKTIVFAATALLAINGLFAQQDAQPHLYFFTNPGCAPCKQVEPENPIVDFKGLSCFDR